MSQPLDFVNSHFLDFVCKLHKALYSLKQAPRASYNALKDFLITYGFLNSQFGTSLVVYNRDSVVAYFLVYVDDLLLTGNNDSILNAFKNALALKFSLKDLGSPHHFLGMEILSRPYGLFLSQQHYVREFLISTNMQDAKPVSTPLSTSCDLTTTSNAPSCDIWEFCPIIGCLQYLYLTNPNVCFSVNKLSQYMQVPIEIHMKAAKCLLHHLKGTLDHGLHLSCVTNLKL